jgi:hypothetical protein
MAPQSAVSVVQIEPGLKNDRAGQPARPARRHTPLALPV